MRITIETHDECTETRTGTRTEASPLSMLIVPPLYSMTLQVVTPPIIYTPVINGGGLALPNPPDVYKVQVFSCDNTRSPFDTIIVPFVSLNTGEAANPPLGTPAPAQVEYETVGIKALLQTTLLWYQTMTIQIADLTVSHRLFKPFYPPPADNAPIVGVTQVANGRISGVGDIQVSGISTSGSILYSRQIIDGTTPLYLQQSINY
jgi:hypothetical protein